MSSLLKITVIILFCVALIVACGKKGPVRPIGINGPSSTVKADADKQSENCCN